MSATGMWHTLSGAVKSVSRFVSWIRVHLSILVCQWKVRAGVYFVWTNIYLHFSMKLRRIIWGWPFVSWAWWQFPSPIRYLHTDHFMTQNDLQSTIDATQLKRPDQSGLPSHSPSPSIVQMCILHGSGFSAVQSRCSSFSIIIGPYCWWCLIC